VKLLSEMLKIPANNTDSKKGGLIVRVKRRRDQEPSDSLCIVDDSELPASKRSPRTLSSGMAATSLFEKTRSDGSRLRRFVMRRVNTVQSATDGAGNDVALLSAKRDRSSSMDDATKDHDDVYSGGSTIASKKEVDGKKQHSGAPKLLVTRGKKVLRGNDGNFIVVDLSMESSGDGARTADGSAPQPTTTKFTLPDPPTRRLQAALDSGFAPNTAPAQVASALNDALTAVVQGARVEHARQNGGQTVLMLAARMLNTRAAERILARGANVHTQDAHGRTALEYAHGIKECPQPVSNSVGGVARAAVEAFVLLLNRTAAAHPLPVSSWATGSVPGEVDPLEDISAYVFDIFCLDEPSKDSEVQAESGPTTAENPDDQMTVEDSSFTTPLVVQVPGLRLGADGSAELVFAYDSDWSDLGDDEDPDSNDERYAGNDYPEGEQSEDEAFYREHYPGYGSDDGAKSGSSDSDASSEAGRQADKRAFRSLPAQLSPRLGKAAGIAQVQSMMGNEEEEDDEGDYGDVKGFYRGMDHSRDTTGRVQHITFGDDQEDAYGVDEQPGMDWSDMSGAAEHRDRLLSLRTRRLGSEVGPSHGFDGKAMTQSAPELSDDDDDERIMQGMFTDRFGQLKQIEQQKEGVFSLPHGIVERQQLRTTAWDPEFDDDDDDY
jgi:hypothetical protein